MRIILVILMLGASFSAFAGRCSPEGWFADVGIGYNLDNPANGQDFAGGRDVAIFGIGYEWENNEVGYGHRSHYFRGWPGEDLFGWEGYEEQLDMFYFKRRFRW